MVIVVGMGQLGRLFGAGLLARGHTVVPVRRGEALPKIEPELCVIAVGEDDLGPVLSALPATWQDRVALCQNELLPPDWEAHGIARPTVAVVWCEKKAGRPLAVVRETEVAGPHASLLVSVLAAVDVPAREIADAELEAALVVKDLYILVSNFAGLAGASTTGELLGSREALASSIARDVLAIDAARVGHPLDDSLLSRMREAFAADPQHGCRGRTAEARLARTIARARRLGVQVPALDALASTR